MDGGVHLHQPHEVGCRDAAALMADNNLQQSLLMRWEPMNHGHGEMREVKQGF